MRHIVSFSGGKDSTALLLMMLEKGMPVDDIVFFDGGWDFPQMYDHVRKIENYIGMKITRVYPNETFDHYMFNYQPMRGNYVNKKGLSWPDFKNRWCTRYKINAINKYCNQFPEKKIYQGIAFDEAKRIKDDGNYPLFDWQITEKEALDYCYSKGFYWDGLYTKFNRVSCFCCPLQRISELKELCNNYPNLWKKLKQMDNNTWRNFRHDYSIKELEMRFLQESKQTSLFEEFA